MCLSDKSPFNKARKFALWLWSAHNKVNERLRKAEAALGTGDAKFPKLIWPPKQLCPSCYADHDPGNNRIAWNRDEVYKFLTSYYGNTLSSLYNGKNIGGNDGIEVAVEESIASTNAVAVPIATTFT
ncbi:hypothetical protein QN277_003809 [Acacia crassicarpa]|uniref:Sulfhydryl oxidase n=1 Tax=Acacia crassicarpa TaxID=499986 RepID=A0AAE1J180_9FABA|nr:hypothetical protein QN277_003809 [Acacia crassicarpa]